MLLTKVITAYIPVFLLLLVSILLAYQDYKKRTINLGITLGFGALSIFTYLTHHTFYEFMFNVLFCIVYCLLSYFIVKIYYYFKSGKHEKIINSKFGLGDVLIILIIGFCMQPPMAVYFFTVSFVLSLVIYFIFPPTVKSVPLAGNLSVMYSLYLLTGLFFPNLE